ncbi:MULTISPECIES: phospholipase [unclassified Streptomyces]|uniref:phospholipase n=1 Tax=unclassified Streptomyces TaxID=2593676 RepID=UPI001BED2032|nr:MULTISPECIES: phospholipase [unclassified Streptomyces]MBT2404829.1 phospholipase [Streptomyces sp. ISL-21]MBT2612553.1 phospholipase [Streptomyces sp. ISL-87]
MRRRLVPAFAAAAAAGVLAFATPASAAPADKPQVLSSWTQTSATSYNAWVSARANQGTWSAYGLDWSTDYCSSSPDNPFGFPFQTSCARHDFGYRNYKAAGSFDANKSRLDDAFYADLKRVCAQYTGAKKTSCDGTAWTYYQAVKAFGVSPQDAPAA